MDRVTRDAAAMELATKGGVMLARAVMESAMMSVIVRDGATMAPAMMDGVTRDIVKLVVNGGIFQPIYFAVSRALRPG